MRSAIWPQPPSTVAARGAEAGGRARARLARAGVVAGALRPQVGCGEPLANAGVRLRDVQRPHVAGGVDVQLDELVQLPQRALAHQLHAAQLREAAPQRGAAVAAVRAAERAPLQRLAQHLWAGHRLHTRIQNQAPKILAPPRLRVQAVVVHPSPRVVAAPADRQRRLAKVRPLLAGVELLPGRVLRRQPVVGVAPAALLHHVVRRRGEEAVERRAQVVHRGAVVVVHLQRWGAGKSPGGVGAWRAGGRGAGGGAWGAAGSLPDSRGRGAGTAGRSSPPRRREAPGLEPAPGLGAPPWGDGDCASAPLRACTFAL